ncbi:MAG: transglutaminase-like domain-containing protein [Gammaproteobacteria bacterium]|nr:transglutaminase-like domain-containing protein [Gammaproteobacteria bacterium]
MKPRIIQGLAILAWGIQADLIWFALPIAVILEARYFQNRRWALTKKDLYLVADLTSVAMVGMIIFLFLNARTYHFITTLIQWLPILFSPLVIVLAYSTTEKMTMDILIYSLRRQKEPVQQSWDMDYLLLGLCILAAGFNTNDYSLFFPLAAFAVFWSLFPLRSTRYQTGIWILAVCITFISAGFTHQVIREAHLVVKAKSEQWIANWITQRTDPLKTRTALGKVGRLKLSDSILFRIKPIGDQSFPDLLHEASYDYSSTGTSMEWAVWKTSFSAVPHEDDFTWRFSDTSPEENAARIYLEFSRESSLVPVPVSLSEIHNLPALEVKLNKYGAIQGNGLVPSPYFDIKYSLGSPLYGPPGEIDLYLDEEHVELLSRIVDRANYPAKNAIAFIQGYFSDFKYSLFQEVRVESNPLEHFLYSRKAGHCEYFASATALLLRQMGVPSRYVVGYSVQEYNGALGMYIVRQRHAHAWAIAYVGGDWRVVDTTPHVWLAEEDNNANLLQPVFDFFANYSFMFRLWWNDQKIEDYEFELYVIGGILVLILLWRIATSEQVIISDKEKEENDSWLPGRESPFFKIEDYLSEEGLKRYRGEVLRRWLIRIQKPELLPLLGIHNRWRFDPVGVGANDKIALNKQVDNWILSQADQDSSIR